MIKRFSSGKYTPKNAEKYIGKKLPTWRSSWEFSFMKFCDEHPSVLQWASESIKIPYQHPITGKQSMYVPDFFISYVDKNGKKHVELVEIKPMNQTLKEKTGRSRQNQIAWIVNQAKWQSARAFCKQKGIFFRVVNEGDIFFGSKK